MVSILAGVTRGLLLHVHALRQLQFYATFNQNNYCHKRPSDCKMDTQVKFETEMMYNGYVSLIDICTQPLHEQDVESHLGTT